jgi:hypothetical protein
LGRSVVERREGKVAWLFRIVGSPSVNTEALNGCSVMVGTNLVKIWRAEVCTMANDRFVIIKVNIETGAVEFEAPDDVTRIEDKPEGIPAAVKTEIDEIRRGKKRYLRVGEIIQTTESPGCVYWDGVRWIKFC